VTPRGGDWGGLDEALGVNGGGAGDMPPWFEEDEDLTGAFDGDDDLEGGEEEEEELVMDDEDPDDLELLGSLGEVPRPRGVPACETLPPEIFDPLLVTYQTLAMCGPALLGLSHFPLDWLVGAVTGTDKGLCPTLYLE
jgi:hypothetical protein